MYDSVNILYFSFDLTLSINSVQSTAIRTEDKKYFGALTDFAFTLLLWMALAEFPTTYVLMFLARKHFYRLEQGVDILTVKEY